MCKFLKTLYLTFVIICPTLSARTIVDMAGREITLPTSIQRLLPYDVKTSLMIYPIAKHKMVARAKMQGRSTFDYMDAYYNALPQYDVRNIEEILTYAPDLIITATGIGRSNTDKYLRLGKRLSIPVVLIDLSINKLNESYRFLGELLGEDSTSLQCATYLQRTLSELSTWAYAHPKNKGAYFTLGNQGLLTDSKGSVHTEVLDYLHIPNVVEIPISTGGHSQVNMEQIITWNPDYIFVADYRGKNDGYQHIIASTLWQNISAVKSQQVYKIPYYPVGWFDHPPSINRVLGLIWLCHTYYALPSDVTEKYITDFFSLFFNYTLSQTDYENIIHP